MENITNRFGIKTFGHEAAVYIDGACSGNPGPGGCCSIIFLDGEKYTIVNGYKRTTNNRMELMALIQALESLPLLTRVTVYTDSQYVKNVIKGAAIWEGRGWKNGGKIISNIDLVKRFLDIKERYSVLLCEPMTKDMMILFECDKHAKQAAKNPTQEDTGYVR